MATSPRSPSRARRTRWKRADDDEVRQLSELAKAHQIADRRQRVWSSVPGVIFVEAQPLWAPHMILTLSLSKLGLRGHEQRS